MSVQPLNSAKVREVLPFRSDFRVKPQRKCFTGDAKSGDDASGKAAGPEAPPATECSEGKPSAKSAHSWQQNHHLNSTLPAIINASQAERGQQHDWAFDSATE